MAPAIITEADLLEALATAVPGKGPDEARTTREIMRETGLGEHSVQRGLRILSECGRLGVHRVTRRSFDGRWVQVQGYTVLPASKRGKK